VIKTAAVIHCGTSGSHLKFGIYCHTSFESCTSTQLHDALE